MITKENILLDIGNNTGVIYYTGENYKIAEEIVCTIISNLKNKELEYKDLLEGEIVRGDIISLYKEEHALLVLYKKESDYFSVAHSDIDYLRNSYKSFNCINLNKGYPIDFFEENINKLIKKLN